MKAEIVKRLLVDSSNLQEIREKFLNGVTITPDEENTILNTTPTHPHISWGENSFTLISWEGIEFLHNVISNTINIEGDFIETGVWRGGMCILTKAIYNELNSDKKVFVADSFEGLPKPDPKYKYDIGDQHYLSEYLKVSVEEVTKNFKIFDCLDNNVIFLKGWFKDTLPTAPIGKLSILRLDGDMYESTIDALTNLYHKLSIGGYCIIDDYLHNGCQMAVEDFRKQNNITEPIIKVSGHPNDEIHYWIKQK
jgi:O-methyltransferase